MLIFQFSTKSLKIILICGVVFLGSIIYCSVPGWTAAPPSVFIVHSYGPEHLCGKPQISGNQRAFREKYYKNAGVVFKQFYMRTKTTYTSKAQIRERGRLAMQEIKIIHPNVAITCLASYKNREQSVRHQPLSDQTFQTE